MAASLSRTLQSYLLLSTVLLAVVQAQIPVSDYCRLTCVEPITQLPHVDGQPYVCTSQGFQEYQDCVCRSCPISDVDGASSQLSSICVDGEYPGPVDCANAADASGSSDFSGSPDITGSSSQPTDGSDSSGGFDSGSSSSSSSSRRRGSKAGIKAGIAVGVIAGILIVLGIFYFVVGRLRFRKMQKEKNKQSAAATTTPGAPGTQNQELDSNEKPSQFDNQPTINLTNPSQMNPSQMNPNQMNPSQTNPPIYAEMPIHQPQQPPQVHHPQGELGPRWGEVPNSQEGPTSN